jgi:hypothetical protein
LIQHGFAARITALIALVATHCGPPANAHLPWLIYNASGSAQLGFYGVKNLTPSRPRPGGRPAIRNARKSSRERWCPARRRASAQARDCRGPRPNLPVHRVVYASGTVAAEASIMVANAVRCLSGRGARDSSKAISSSSNPIPIPSKAGISDRSATAKLSASRGGCGRGTHRNDTPVLSPARMIEQP